MSCKYDDDELWDKVNELDDRVTSIESTLSKMNSEISSLSTIVNALENNVYVSSVEEIENGYNITFTDGKTAVIYNGKDGADGENGKDAPVIGIEEYEGTYYWVQIIDGEKGWLTDKDGNKIPVTGEDAVTPILKVSAEGYWMISYNRGITFELLLDENGAPVKAVGTDGADGADGVDGADGADGDSFFSDVKVVDGKLILILKDGTIIEVPMVASVGDLTKILTTTEGIGDWDKAYITSKGYFLYRDNVKDLNVASSRSSVESPQECLSFISIDGEKAATMLFSKEEKLPVQFVYDDQILNFSFLNDSILELVFDDGTTLEMVDSIPYSLKDMESKIKVNGYDDELKKTLFYFIYLIDSHIADYPQFRDMIEIFKSVLEFEYEINSEIVIESLYLQKDDGVYEFVTRIEIEYTIVITKI